MQNIKQLQHTKEDMSVYNGISTVDVITERVVCILRHLRSGEWLPNRNGTHSENLQAVYVR